jgi:hydrogenase expression/formation protein HypC
MCLAIPGKITEITESDSIRSGRIQFGGIVRQACLDFVPQAKVGDYVLVHVGFALTVVDKDEAERTYALLESMGVLSEELALDPGGSKSS